MKSLPRTFLLLVTGMSLIAGESLAIPQCPGGNGGGPWCVLVNSATAMQAILSGDKGLPTSILDKADCIVVFPSVKKVAIGIGGSYGRGVMVCRTGANKNGSWGAPAMYKLDQGSIGVQLGSTATDFVLVVMNEKGAEQILNGKTKLGGNAAAAAGPTGAAANGYNADSMKVDVLTYSRTKGLFAGISLEGAYETRRAYKHSSRSDQLFES
jgi:lipid-binding SYLF domain-containing protein